MANTTETESEINILSDDPSGIDNAKATAGDLRQALDDMNDDGLDGAQEVIAGVLRQWLPEDEHDGVEDIANDIFAAITVRVDCAMALRRIGIGRPSQVVQVVVHSPELNDQR